MPLVRRRVESFENEHRGVVHEDVDAAEIGGDARHRAGDVLLAGDVGPIEASAVEPLRDRFTGVVAIEDGDSGSLFGEELGGGLADPGGAAGYDRDFAVDTTATAHSMPDRFTASSASFSGFVEPVTLRARAELFEPG